MSCCGRYSHVGFTGDEKRALLEARSRCPADVELLIREMGSSYEEFLADQKRQSELLLMETIEQVIKRRIGNAMAVPRSYLIER